MTSGRPRQGAVVRLEAVGDVRPPDGQPWTAAEERRAARLRRGADRAAFLAARVTARSCVAELLDVLPAEVVLGQKCPECGSGDHGTPHVVDHPEVYVAWSHTERAVAAVAATEPCGIDVEPVGRIVASALTRAEAAWVASQAVPELAFARLWTRKEALVKTGAVTLDEAVRTDVRGLDVDPGWTLGERALAVRDVDHQMTWLLRRSGQSKGRQEEWPPPRSLKVR